MIGYPMAHILCRSYWRSRKILGLLVLTPHIKMGTRVPHQDSGYFRNNHIDAGYDYIRQIIILHWYMANWDRLWCMDIQLYPWHAVLYILYWDMVDIKVWYSARYSELLSCLGLYNIYFGTKFVESWSKNSWVGPQDPNRG